MRRMLLATLLSILPAESLLADTEFEDSIPIEIVKVLMAPTGTEAALYADLPANFPEFQLPAELSVLGSMKIDSLTRVAFETDLS
ncbi:MAG: hypothetical protein DHS20C12_30130 [Pseudohongiella sp.]|nr:MAG: hypothetical protein DHS20C12_30130 [Pseudohongiella sp.]